MQDAGEPRQANTSAIIKGEGGKQELQRSAAAVEAKEAGSVRAAREELKAGGKEPPSAGFAMLPTSETVTSQSPLDNDFLALSIETLVKTVSKVKRDDCAVIINKLHFN